MRIYLGVPRGEPFQNDQREFRIVDRERRKDGLLFQRLVLHQERFELPFRSTPNCMTHVAGILVLIGKVLGSMICKYNVRAATRIKSQVGVGTRPFFVVTRDVAPSARASRIWCALVVHPVAGCRAGRKNSVAI